MAYKNFFNGMQVSSKKKLVFDCVFNTAIIKNIWQKVFLS